MISYSTGIKQQTFHRTGFNLLTKLLLLSCIFALIGCGSSENGDLKKYLRKIKSRPPQPIEPIPTFVLPKQYSYPENKKRRSPFSPIAKAAKKDVLAPNLKRQRQPLEAYSLDSLKFVGILEINSTIWGLIKQPNGIVTRIKPGDYIGKNFGQVQKISDDRIDIVETMQVAGKWEKKPVSLKLAAP